MLHLHLHIPIWEHDPTLVDVRLAHVAVTTGDLDRM